MLKNKQLNIQYARTSTEYQFTEQQKRALNEAVKDDPLTEWTYMEEKVSGKKMTGKVFTSIWDDVKADKVARIMVYSIDRLGRNLRQGTAFIQDCIDSGVNMQFLRESHIDLNTAVGRFGFQIHMSFAELEGSLISERTAAGLKTAALRCDTCGHYSEKNRIRNVFICEKCQGRKARFEGGVKRGSKWMTTKIAAHVDEILRLFDAKFSRYRIAQMLKLDERTIARIINNRENLPSLRECVWDK